MNNIIQQRENLPTSLDDLSRFVLVGREKLTAVRAEIRAIEKVGLAQEVREQKLKEAQDISEAVLDAEVRIGELMKKVPKASGGDHGNQYTGGKNDTVVDFGKPKSEVIREAGFTPKQVERFQQLADHPELVAQAKAEARENDDVVSRSLVLSMIKAEEKKAEIQAAAEAIQAQAVEEPDRPVLYVGDGIGYKPDEPYDLLLTDPPYSTDVDNVAVFAATWLPQALQNVKPTGSAYIFIGAYPKEIKAYLQIVPPAHMELVQILVWTYKNTLGQNPKDRYKQNWQACLYYRGIGAPPLDCPLTTEQWAVQEINAPDGRQGDRYHAWQKPIEIAERFIRHSTKPGMTVFDPFACTGTFLLAASKLGRTGYGFEIDDGNAKIAEERGCKLVRIRREP